VQTLAVVLSVDRYAAWVVRHHADPLAMRMLALGDMVAIRRPEDIRALFTADPAAVEAGSANALALGRALGTSSMMVLDGDEHLRLRRLLLPPFHGEAVRAHRLQVEAATRAQLARWPAGHPFAVLPHMRAIAIDVVLRAVLGVRDPARRDALLDVLPQVLQLNPLLNVADGAHPRIGDSRIGRRLPWMRARRRLDRLLHEEIAAHRAAPEDRDDVLALLIAARGADGRPLTDAELRDQLFTLLVAGNETTASALAWCFERLARHPAALARATAEARGEVPDQGYLAAVAQETLRVRPIIDVVWRKLAVDTQVGGHHLPAGTLVTASVRAVQRSSAFPEPEAFRPERFLGAGPPPYTHIPFGGGRRRCIGAAFATMELETVLATVLRAVDVTPRPGARPERQSRLRTFTTVPARGGRVTVRPVAATATAPAQPE
jgi:cytochrome P450